MEGSVEGWALWYPITEGQSNTGELPGESAIDTPRRRSGLEHRPPVALLVVAEVALLVFAVAVIARLGRRWFFLHDEWGFVFYRRSGGAEAFFAPFHGHLFAGVIALYRILFATVGLRHYGAYLGVEIALNVLCSLLLFLYALRRGVSPFFAVVASSVLVLLGPAWEVIYWLAGAGFIIAIICMLAVLLTWDSGIRGANVITFVLACIAVGSHDTGVPVVAGLIVASMGLGRSTRRILALGIPLAAWVVWFSALRGHISTPAALRAIPGASPNGDVGVVGGLTAHLAELPQWLARAGVGAFASLAGRPAWTGLGVLLGLATLAGIAWTWNRGTLDRWRAGGVAVAVVGFWLATGVSRAQVSSPVASRYLYPGVALLLILLLECVRGVRVHAGVVAAVCVVAVLTLVVHVDALHQESNQTARAFAHERRVLSLLEGCRDRIPPTFVEVQGVPAGPFWAATAALGSPVTPVPAPNRMCPETPPVQGGQPQP